MPPSAPFTVVEYALRVWCALEHPPFAGMSALAAARRAFIVSGAAIVDLLAISPVYLSFVVAQDLRVLIFPRLPRFFKLARYSPGMRSLLVVLKAERKALGASAMILFTRFCSRPRRRTSPNTPRSPTNSARS